jgi:DNA-binding NtrC family response regulator
MTAKSDAVEASARLEGRRVVLLELSGYVVTAFDRFEDAKKHLATTVPDVLITDVRLGGSNGLHLVVMTKLRHPEMIAVVMTGYDDIVLKKDAEAAGAHYVVKPILVADLIALLATAVPVAEQHDR